MKNCIQKGGLKIMIRQIEEINKDIAVYTEKLSIVKKEFETKNIELSKSRESNRRLLLLKAGKNIKGKSLDIQTKLLVNLSSECNQYEILIAEIEQTIKKLNEELSFAELHEQAEDYIFKRADYVASLEELKASARAINRNISNLANIAGKINKPFASCFLPLVEKIRSLKTFAEFIAEQKTASYVDYTRYKDYVASGEGYSVNLEEFIENENVASPDTDKNKAYLIEEQQYYQQSLAGFPLLKFQDLQNLLLSLESLLKVNLTQKENSPINTIQHISDFKSETMRESGVERRERLRQEKIAAQQKELNDTTNVPGYIFVESAL